MAEKKQTFLHGAMLLAISTAVVKVIGALYKLPLNAVIGAEGYAYFTTAYEIYAVLLIISTAGDAERICVTRTPLLRLTGIFLALF